MTIPVIDASPEAVHALMTMADFVTIMHYDPDDIPILDGEVGCLARLFWDGGKPKFDPIVRFCIMRTDQ